MKGAIMLFVLIMFAVVAGIMLNNFIGSYMDEKDQEAGG